MPLTEQILTQVIAHKFPWWGQCHFQLNSLTRTLYIHSSDLRKRRLIAQEMRAIAALDIHLQRIILRQPNQPDISIQCVYKPYVCDPYVAESKDANNS